MPPRPFDKYENSPNNQATCKKCCLKILKCSMRVGIVTRSPRFGYYFKYYHRECCSREALRKLKLPGCSGKTCADTDDAVNNKLAAEIMRQNSVRTAARAETQRRDAADDIDKAGLEESLRRFRVQVGDANGWTGKYYLVFTDNNLDEILEKLPTTRKQFLNCNGLGEKKWSRYGSRLVALVRSFKNKKKKKKKSSTSNSVSSDRGRVETLTAVGVVASLEPETIYIDHPTPATPSRRTLPVPVVTPLAGGDDEICIGESLTSDQIVSRKFREAERNGDMIALD
mmetsp:Transcript_14383/g.21294  ORF Transcript_14383/g.21294 Transcript_14383/m.21294 type:complete len:284 (-) Transcript_14383:186-1037(-)|eukprot:CAMPEP_0116034994 /NCGR_PEP_ID=MMETSP0321-20121206/20034_1 /TAXON_ID=163516 /ORGANISM="Leptocylindrus danicus var. danicus, Strain B650" /LENGTH=283 /DNA_ID=CAMNT_0003511603 /DNA_START=69 /DNA_END=920 /DNA_ORIENTATION=-